MYTVQSHTKYGRQRVHHQTQEPHRVEAEEGGHCQQGSTTQDRTQDRASQANNETAVREAEATEQGGERVFERLLLQAFGVRWPRRAVQAVASPLRQAQDAEEYANQPTTDVGLAEQAGGQPAPQASQQDQHEYQTHHRVQEAEPCTGRPHHTWRRQCTQVQGHPVRSGRGHSQGVDRTAPRHHEQSSGECTGQDTHSCGGGDTRQRKEVRGRRIKNIQSNTERQW